MLRAQGIYKRPIDKKQNTEFTYLRFLVPYLAGYKGWALFTDDDFMWRADIAELLDLVRCGCLLSFACSFALVCRSRCSLVRVRRPTTSTLSCA